MAEFEGAIGLIETRGIVPLTAGLEAMLKTADVTCVSVERISSGYFAAAIQGSVAAVRQAIEAGGLAVQQYGELRSSQVYPKPAARAVDVLTSTSRALLATGQDEAAAINSSQDD